MSEEQQQQAPVAKERTKSIFGGTREKCAKCQKTVYEKERMSVDNIIFHDTCFRCAHCNNKLTLAKYAALNGEYYCKPHFKELFKRKGRYTFEGHEGGEEGDADDEVAAPTSPKATTAAPTTTTTTSETKVKPSELKKQQTSTTTTAPAATASNELKEKNQQLEKQVAELTAKVAELETLLAAKTNELEAAREALKTVATHQPAEFYESQKQEESSQEEQGQVVQE